MVQNRKNIAKIAISSFTLPRTWENGRASDLVLTYGFLAVLAHSRGVVKETRLEIKVRLEAHKLGVLAAVRRKCVEKLDALGPVNEMRVWERR